MTESFDKLFLEEMMPFGQAHQQQTLPVQNKEANVPQAKPVEKKTSEGMTYEQINRNNPEFARLQNGCSKMKWIVSSQYQQDGPFYMTAGFYSDKDAHAFLRSLVTMNTAKGLKHKVYYAP